MTSKTLIENATEAAKKTVKATKNAAGVANDRINETADRARAAGHEVMAEASDNPITKASETVKAGVDKVKSTVHGAMADAKSKRK
jgi:vacuolar-type H+-ATPase subunit H